MEDDFVGTPTISSHGGKLADLISFLFAKSSCMAAKAWPFKGENLCPRTKVDQISDLGWDLAYFTFGERIQFDDILKQIGGVWTTSFSVDCGGIFSVALHGFVYLFSVFSANG